MQVFFPLTPFLSCNWMTIHVKCQLSGVQQLNVQDKEHKTRADPITPTFKLDDSPFYRLAQVENTYRERMQASLKAIGMDLPRWRVLMVLHEKSPSTVSEIATRSAMKLSTMTKVAQRLEKEGFVELKQSDTDARSTNVHLAAKGRSAVDKIRQVASRIYRQATQDLNDNDIGTLNRLLRALQDGMG